MFFNLIAMVRNPSAELIDELNKLHQRPHHHITRSGVLTYRVILSRKLSHELDKEGWEETGRSFFQFAPVFSSEQGTTCAYPIPEPFLAEGVNLDFKIEATEVDSHGCYCQVVTDMEGEALKPYRFEGKSRDAAGCPTAAVFSTSLRRGMGLLRLDVNQPRRQASITVLTFVGERTDATVICKMRRLAFIEDPRLNELRQTSLIDFGCSAWDPALAALYERFECEAWSCEGHFTKQG